VAATGAAETVAPVVVPPRPLAGAQAKVAPNAVAVSDIAVPEQVVPLAGATVTVGPGLIPTVIAAEVLPQLLVPLQYR
jgi:hypothetical protein